MKGKLAQKLYAEIIYVHITKPIIFQFSIHTTKCVVAILVKFDFFTSPFVPKLGQVRGSSDNH